MLSMGRLCLGGGYGSLFARSWHMLHMLLEDYGPQIYSGNIDWQSVRLYLIL